MVEVSTEAQRLHRVVSAALRERGPCDIPAEKGTVRLHPSEQGEVRIEALSSSGKSLFTFMLTRGSCVLAGGIDAEVFRERFGSEAVVLRGIRKTIERSRPIEKDGQFNLNSERMPKTPLEGEPPRGGTLERERFDYVKQLDQALTNSEGRKVEMKGFLVGDRVFDIRRNGSDPYSFVVEVGSRDGHRDSLLGPRVVASLGGISYHNSDDAAPAGSEQNAIRTLADWMSRLGLAAPVRGS
jgi:hypothetical protein